MTPLRVLLLLLTLYASKSWAEDSQKITNKQWVCEGCNNERESSRLLHLIDRAALSGERLSYLALDMSWLDRLGESSSRLKVYLRKFDSIDDIVETPVNSENKMQSNETFYAMAFYAENSSNAFTRSARISQYQKAVDTFLAINPCWIPLLEPSASLFFKHQQLLIFIRLPEMSHHATCKLYSAIVKIQFPKVCIYDSDHLNVYMLANIGYGHVLRNLMLGLVSSLNDIQKARVFTAPIAQKFMSRQNLSFVQGVDVYVNPQLWSWADPNLCDHEKFKNDPWACNFIAFTNCSNRELSSNISTVPELYDSNVLAKNKIISKDLRIRYDDSPNLQDRRWLETRMYAFTQRPNAQLRRKLLISLQAVKQLSLSGQHIERNSKKKNPKQGVNSGILKLPSCATMHIRHNDAALDGRSRGSVDRSFPGHMTHMFNLSSMTNITHIFLATDNRTVVEIASEKYPNFTWYNQQRPMSNSTNLYRMFTKTIHLYAPPGGEFIVAGHESNGLEIKNITNSEVEEDIRELVNYSVQKDLSHILADVRFGSLCAALIGAHDSGFTEAIYTTMCGVNRRGKCPMSIDVVKTDQLVKKTIATFAKELQYNPVSFDQ